MRDAKATRARLLESQHAAERARADYHHAIRRLHAAGGSLREIAEVLHLSHQRVHQIIDEAAEPSRPWWRRRGRRQGPAGPCSFCGRPREECTKLIAGPGVFICDRCVAQASRLAPDAAVDGRAGGRCGWKRRGRRSGAASAARRLARWDPWSQRAGGGAWRQVWPGSSDRDECLDLYGRSWPSQ